MSGEASSENPGDGGGSSLLSLSIAASNAAPITVPGQEDHPSPEHGSVDEMHTSSNNSHSADISYSISSGPAVHNAMKHRRLSSLGQSKRRLSDARDAASRPSPAGLQAATAALTALASLSLSSSPVQNIGGLSPSGAMSHSAASATLTAPVPIPNTAPRKNYMTQLGVSAPVDDGANLGYSPSSAQDTQETSPDMQKNGASSSVTKNGKKRGTIFTCESCSKVYRHPSCLIKHRWEHSPHWREASKFLLSKHQQVQLMEAAAILSHMSPTTSGGSSLPDDRSLWPSFLSGGTLPPPSASGPDASSPGQRARAGTAGFPAHPISSSVPTRSVLSSRATSAGPRLHDYSIPSASNGTGSITHLRPGVLAVPNGGDRGSPSPFSLSGSNSGVISPYAHEDDSFTSFSMQTPASLPSAQSYTRSEGTGAWSSSFSASSRSRSSPHSEESELLDVDGDEFGELQYVSGGFSSRGRTSMARFGADDDAAPFSVKEEEEEEEWDGMEMEMEL